MDCIAPRKFHPPLPLHAGTNASVGSILLTSGTKIFTKRMDMKILLGDASSWCDLPNAPPESKIFVSSQDHLALPSFAIDAGTRPSCTFMSLHRFTFHTPPLEMKR
jgi:hypothetical protein